MIDRLYLLSKISLVTERRYRHDDLPLRNPLATIVFFLPSMFTLAEALPATDYSLSNNRERANLRMKAMEDTLDPYSKQTIQPYLDQKPQGRYLEIRPGRGTMAVFIAGSGAAVDVLDEEDTYFELMKVRSLKINTLHGNLQSYPLNKQQYDCIYWRYVMLHIPEQSHQAIADKLYQALKPGGILIAEALVAIHRQNGLAAFDRIADGLSHYMDAMSSRIGQRMDFNSGFDFEDRLKRSGFTLPVPPYLFVEECYGGQPCSGIMKLTFRQ